MSISRRKVLRGAGGGLAGILASGVAPYSFVRNIAKAAESDTIKVGILHSLSGTVAIIETSLKNAEVLAMEEINAKGGVLGKKLEPVIEDPQSMVQVFAEKAKKLLLEEKVVAVLGCYTSASILALAPLIANSRIVRETNALRRRPLISGSIGPKTIAFKLASARLSPTLLVRMRPSARRSSGTNPIPALTA